METTLHLYSCKIWHHALSDEWMCAVLSAKERANIYRPAVTIHKPKVFKLRRKISPEILKALNGAEARGRKQFIRVSKSGRKYYFPVGSYSYRHDINTAVH